jgi:hypothetical protein
MPTLTIQIGNSDDKLTQVEWSAFVSAIRQESILKNCVQIHFAGAPRNDERWQNFCFVVECQPEQVAPLKASLTDIRKVFNQDSVALTIGETEFV